MACTDDDTEIKVLAEYVRGIVLSGGGDVDPFFYGEEPHPDSRRICPKRDVFEIALSRFALSANIPILGVCRGIQVLNIAAGGDIYQDIYSQLPGNQLIKHCQEAPQWYPTHGINIEAGTMLSSVMGGNKLRVNSYHHQAVRNVAPDFIVSACSEDGIIEAIESTEHHYALGLQCHPESLWRVYPAFLRPFVELVNAAQG